MNRRDVLTGIGFVSVTALAGCSTTDESEELPTEQPAVDSTESSTDENTSDNSEVREMKASAGVTFDETVDSVRVQLVSVQAADHIYVEGPDEESITGGVLDGGESSYESDLSGQYLYTQDSYGQEVGGAGSLVEYQKGDSAGRVYVIGVLDEVETIISSYEFLPKGEEPQ